MAVFAMERLRHFLQEENLRAAFQAADGAQTHRAEALCFVRTGFQPGMDAVCPSF
jgi:hypothetical protein